MTKFAQSLLDYGGQILTPSSSVESCTIMKQYKFGTIQLEIKACAESNLASIYISHTNSGIHLISLDGIFKENNSGLTDLTLLNLSILSKHSILWGNFVTQEEDEWIGI